MFVRYATDHRRRLVSGLTLAAVISVFLAALPACAATWTWDGGAGNDNWTNGQNWVGDVSPVNDGTADIVFAGATRLTPNLPINWSINSLTFDNTAGAFDLKSAPQSNLTIGAGGITTFSANRHAFEHLVTLSAPQTWTSASNSGGLGFPLFGPVVNGGHLLTMNVDGGSIALEGTLNGAGGLTKEGLGDLVLFPVVIVARGNSFTGATNVNCGQLYLHGHELLTTIPGELRIGDGVGTTIDSVVNQNHNQIANSSSVSIASTGLWDLSNFSEAITNLVIVSAGVANGASVTMTSGTLTVLGNLTMTGGAVTASAGGRLLLTGNLTTNSSNTAARIGGGLDLNLGSHSFFVDNGAALHDLDVTSVVSNGAIVKDGPGALRLGGANIYAGGTTLNTGAIVIGHDSALGTGSLTVNGGTLQADGGSRKIANFLNLNAGFAVDGAFDLTFAAPVNLDGAITKNGVSALTFASSSAIGDMLTINAGTIRIDADVSVGGGLANSGTVLVAQTLTVNGTGFTNQGSLSFMGGSLAGSGAIVNNAIVSGSGTIGGTGGFTNNAQLTVSGGNLMLVNTGPNANIANITVGDGLQLRLTGGTLANTGAVILDGGVVAGSATLSNIAGGVVGGHGLISVPFANSGGTLRVVGGTMNVTGAFTNNGVIRIDDGAALVGGAITNSGRIQGDGSIANALTNSAGGSIRVDAGRTLFFRGAFAANAGEMNLQGGTLDFTNAITNSSSGFIAGRGALYTGGLTNNGQMAFSGGATDIHGDVALNAGSRAVTSGSGATTTFFDDVTHNGTEIFTGAGASTVIFGALSGVGPFTGAGTVYSIGDLRPGNSPATVNFGGALVLGSSTALTMELGGLAAGTQHDRLAIAGTVSLAGSLKVSLLDGFVPSTGNSFEIVTAGGRVAGTFGSAQLPVLEGGMTWSLVYGVNSVVIQIGLLGDYNRNGVVDGADYIVYRNTLGQTGVGLWADGNNNNQIDTGDYAVWRAQLGATGGSGLGFSANDAVPEPISLVLVALCVAAPAIRRARRVGIRTCLFTALFFPAAAQGASYTVTDLGVLGAENTLGWGINASGQVTGYAGTSGEDTITGFVWNPTTPNSSTGALHRLGTLGGYFSWGIGINASGQVAGLSSTTDDEAEHATLWNPTTPNGSTGTLYDLGTLGGTYSQGTGINDGGQLTGYADLTGDQESRAIMWKPTTPGSASGTMYDLGSLGGSHSFGWDINATGQVTGDSSTTDNVSTHAMLWKPTSPNGTVGTMHDLGTLGGTMSGGEGINNDGQVAGFSQTTNDEADHAFLWTPSTSGGVAGAMLDLGTLGGVDSYGLAVSNGGLVVGSSAVPTEISNNYHAFIYASSSGMVDLNTLIDPFSGWELLDADDINDIGQITGQGMIDGEYHAFLLTPIPIPGDFNHDATVDAADYVTWRKGIGIAPTQDNYNVWRQHFGQTALGGTGAVANANVPEPTTLLALSLAAACLLLQRRPSYAAVEILIKRGSVRAQRRHALRSIPAAAYVFASMLLLTTQAIPASGQTLPGTYSLSSATATPAGWAQNWTAQLAGTSGWTGADGLYVIPMNANRKLGSAYETPGWQTFSFNDSLIGTVNELDQRTGFRFINNSIGVYSGTSATPTPISFKWKGDQNPPFDSAESMITGPVSGGLYWPLDGIVVPRTGGGQQFVQFAMKINGGLTPTGVSQMTWPVPDGVNYASNWPYNGNRGDTWNSSIDSVGSLPNLYKPDHDGSGPTGELVMGTAILDVSNAATSYAANGYVHIYGTRNDFLSKKVFVARAAPEDVSNPSAWSFWNASSSAWVSGISAINSATPMRDNSNATIGDMAVEYSVTQLPDGRYVMVYLHADALGTQISARYSSAPQGPWSSRQLLYNVSIPNSGNPALGLPDISAYSDWKYVIYGAKAHAQLSEAPSGAGAANAGQLLISFNVNNWKTNGSTSQPDPGWVYGSIYRPRFISVDIVGSLPGDFNDDGTVDAADYIVWRKTGINGPTGYNTWRANFGKPGGGGLIASANVDAPEPTTLVILMFAATGWCLRRDRAQ